jgi:hypothetical protein
MNKRKSTIYFIGIVIIIGLALLILSSSRKTPVSGLPVEKIPPKKSISIITPEDIGLSLSKSTDDKKIVFEVTKIKDIASLDYNLTYASKDRISRAVVVRLNDVNKTGVPVRQEILLGKCDSANACTYYQEVQDIKLVLNIVKVNGAKVQVKKTL